MTAVSSIPVRFGMVHLEPGGIDQPDIYAHRYRKGLRVRWSITAGRDGDTLAWGWALTWGGAMVKAIAAAHRDDVPGVRR
jgi:hypothetical protein